MKKRLEQAGAELAARVKVILSNGRRGSIGSRGTGPGDPPHVDTGALRQSIFWKMIFDNVVRVGTTKVYGLYLEKGAFIRPRTAKLLAIPWSQEARRHSRNGGSMRTFPKKLTLIRSKSGATLGVEIPKVVKRGFGAGIEKMSGKNKGAWIIHYILTKHATIAPHPFLRPALAQMRGRIQEIFSR